MRKLKIWIIASVLLLGAATSCKDDSLVIVPTWESAVHGLAEVTSTNTDFSYNDPTIDLDMELQWISIDSKATVNRIEVFALFNEAYIDLDGNPKVASHGGEDGKSILVLEGSEVPANRTPFNLSVSQSQLYELYKEATFDYGNGEVSVFENPDKPQRNDEQRFMWDDALQIRWEFTTADGRVFDAWGVSVCTEFPGANCQIDFGVACSATIEEPAGDWIFDMKDTYGDGWQGGYISVVVDGDEFDQVNIPNGGGSAKVETITIPGSATSLEFVWSDDDYNSEVVFTIKSPKGNIVANVSNPSAGKIKLNLCLE